MTSFASPATWLPAALARAAVVTASAPAASAARHSAPEASGLVQIVAEDQAGAGRHAEPEWSREMFDATRDEDPFDWLGFSA